MTSMSKLALQHYRRIWIIILLMAIVISSSGWWAMHMPLVVAQSITIAPITIREEVTAAIDPNIWRIQLYQPFTDQVKKVEVVALPNVQLVSILKRDGSYIAALASADSDGLLFVQVGTEYSFGKVQKIDATSVEISSSRGVVRMELKP